MLNTIKNELAKIISITDGDDNELLLTTGASAGERLKAINALTTQLIASINAYEAPDTDEFIISAEAHTDDHLVEVDFDAVRYFEDAKDDELIALIGCDFGGDYPADAVVDYFQGMNKEVDQLFFHTGGDIGFECYINVDEATVWIARNRPHLAKYLTV